MESESLTRQTSSVQIITKISLKNELLNQKIPQYSEPTQNNYNNEDAEIISTKESFQKSGDMIIRTKVLTGNHFIKYPKDKKRLQLLHDIPNPISLLFLQALEQEQTNLLDFILNPVLYEVAKAIQSKNTGSQNNTISLSQNYKSSNINIRTDQFFLLKEKITFNSQTEKKLGKLYEKQKQKQNLNSFKEKYIQSLENCFTHFNHQKSYKKQFLITGIYLKYKQFVIVETLFVFNKFFSQIPVNRVVFCRKQKYVRTEQNNSKQKINLQKLLKIQSYLTIKHQCNLSEIFGKQNYSNITIPEQLLRQIKKKKSDCCQIKVEQLLKDENIQFKLVFNQDFPIEDLEICPLKNKQIQRQEYFFDKSQQDQLFYTQQNVFKRVQDLPRIGYNNFLRNQLKILLNPIKSQKIKSYSTRQRMIIFLKKQMVLNCQPRRISNLLIQNLRYVGCQQKLEYSQWRYQSDQSHSNARYQLFPDIHLKTTYLRYYPNQINTIHQQVVQRIEKKAFQKLLTQDLKVQALKYLYTFNRCQYLYVTEKIENRQLDQLSRNYQLYCIRQQLKKIQLKIISNYPYLNNPQLNSSQTKIQASFHKKIKYLFNRCIDVKSLTKYNICQRCEHLEINQIIQEIMYESSYNQFNQFNQFNQIYLRYLARNLSNFLNIEREIVQKNLIFTKFEPDSLYTQTKFIFEKTIAKIPVQRCIFKITLENFIFNFSIKQNDEIKIISTQDLKKQQFNLMKIYDCHQINYQITQVFNYQHHKKKQNYKKYEKQYLQYLQCKNKIKTNSDQQIIENQQIKYFFDLDDFSKENFEVKEPSIFFKIDNFSFKIHFQRRNEPLKSTKILDLLESSS